MRLTMELLEATLGEMRTVGLKTLKNKLSEYVRLVAAGETIVGTDRNRVVAEIVPPRPGLKRIISDPVLARGIRGVAYSPDASRYGTTAAQTRRRVVV
jgi:prevent-host-death family protein